MSFRRTTASASSLTRPLRSVAGDSDRAPCFASAGMLAAILLLLLTAVASYINGLQERGETQALLRLCRTQEGEKARHTLSVLEFMNDHWRVWDHNLFLIRCALFVGLILLCAAGMRQAERERRRQERRLQLANDRLQELVEQDGLTGLKNRRAFETCLRSEWEQATQKGLYLSLLLVDVDYFKNYNDSYGHLAGDEVLGTAADILRTRCRPEDCVARYGGEEFALVLPGASEATALVTAERLRAAFAAMEWPGRPISVSIGVATYDPVASPLLSAPTDLVHEADIALYCAKYRGRNRVTHARECPPTTAMNTDAPTTAATV